MALLDGLLRLNPFQSAAQSDPWAGLRTVGSRMQRPATTAQERASSRFNPLLASDGPLARGGWIGAAITAGNPTRGEARAAEVGQRRGEIFQSILDEVQAGKPFQRAVYDFMQTPEGVEWLTTDPDPANAMKQFLTLSNDQVAPDPEALAMGRAFGQPSGTVTTPVPTTGQRLTSPTPIAEQALGGEEVPMAMSPEMTPGYFRQRSFELAQQGDHEAAQAAWKMANDIDSTEYKPEDLVVVPDPESPTGYRFMPKTEASGMAAPAPKSLVTLEDKRGSEVDKGIAKIYEERLNEEIFVPARNSRSNMANVSAARTALDAGRFQPGAFGDARLAISRIMEFIGIDPENPAVASIIGTGDPATAETLQSAGNMIAQTMAGNMSRVTNLSLQLIQEAAPQLIKTREGNKIILDLLEMTTQREQEIASFANSFIEDAYARGEVPNLPRMFNEIEKIRDSWMPIDKDIEERLRTEARRGQGVDWKGLQDKTEELTFRTREEAEAYAKEKGLASGTEVIIGGRKFRWDPPTRGE